MQENSDILERIVHFYAIEAMHDMVLETITQRIHSGALS